MTMFIWQAEHSIQRQCNTNTVPDRDQAKPTVSLSIGGRKRARGRFCTTTKDKKSVNFSVTTSILARAAEKVQKVSPAAALPALDHKFPSSQRSM